MSSDPPEGQATRGRQSIPLENLHTSAYDDYRNPSLAQGSADSQRPQGLSLASGSANPPSISTYWNQQPYDARPDDGTSPESPIDPIALQAALPPELHNPGLLSAHDPYNHSIAYRDEGPSADYGESDRVPLTSGAQPMAGSLTAGNNDTQPRDSFQTVSDVDNSPRRTRDTRSLGQDLDPGFRSSQHRSYGPSLNPNEFRRSRSPSGAFSRAGSIVRAMSQRVVNISGESEGIDHRASRHRSRSPSGLSRSNSQDATASMLVDTSYPSQTRHSATEKNGNQEYYASQVPPPITPRAPLPNPLKGKSLGIFSPNNRLRVWLCDLLVNPYTEPLILVLIILQAVLLMVEAAPNVYDNEDGRPKRWGGHAIDWAMLVLFVFFTLELIARIIVSGFILNAAEYSTIDRKKGIKAAVVEQYRNVFQPQRQKSVKGKPQVRPEPSAISRSFTTFMQGQQALPETVEEQQRVQLARRAFLRHSFNRFDFVAVVSFWITFFLSFSGLESHHHIYVFRMLSCLRILRLLALTNGTAVTILLSHIEAVTNCQYL